MSNKGAWNGVYAQVAQARQVDGEDTTAIMAAEFLKDCATVADWGCGWGGFKTHICSSQEYIGIDGSNSPYADVIADLEEYTVPTEGILLRHVLEHNLNYEKILANAVAACTRKLCVVISTPFNPDRVKIIQTYDNYFGAGQAVHDLSLPSRDIMRYLSDCVVELKFGIKTTTQYGEEHIFFARKKDSLPKHR